MLPSLHARLRKANPSIPLSLPLIGAISVIVLLVLGIVAWQVRPFVLWAYNVEKAGALQATALRYPDPRQSDSFPTESDAAANQAALGHLAAAIRWRPHDPYAYRLAGSSYMAQGDWLNAINVLENGAAEADADILLSWELALAYEQVYEQAENAPSTDLVPLFAAADPDAPTLRVETPYCRSGDVRSCYVGIGTFTHPYAAFPDDTAITADALFLHPPARLTIPVNVPQGDPALSFMMGLDPFAQDWGTDGATFQFWVIQADGGILPVYERTIIGNELRQGWVLDSIDLRAWAGQSIQLAVGTDDGPLDDNTGDWVGIGNLMLTDGRSATYRNLMPQQRFRTTIEAGQITDSQLVGRGDEAVYDSNYVDAELWYRRAEWAGVDTTSSVEYAEFLETRDAEGFDVALPALQAALVADRGWGSALNRFTAFLTYGRWLAEEERYVESQAHLNVAVAIYPDPPPVYYGVVAEANRYLAITYSELDDPDAGLPFARRAVDLNANDFNNQYIYGRLRYEADPTQIADVEQALMTAMTLSAGPENWEDVTGVWLAGGDTSRAEGYCQIALKSFALEQLGYACWDATLDASLIHMNGYYRLYQDDPAAGYVKLEDAITVNGGWQDKGQRFEAWETWTLFLFSDEQYDAAIAAGKNALAYQPQVVSDENLGTLNAQIAISYSRLNGYQGSLPYFESALELAPLATTYYEYGIALYGADATPTRAQRAFDQALEVSGNSPLMRTLLIDFWYSQDVTAEADAVCAATALPSLTEQTLCVPSTLTVSSGDLFQQYLEASAVNDPTARTYLEEATALDTGWERLTFRHRAWFDLGTRLWEEQEYEDAVVALQTALAASDTRISTAMRAETYRFIGLVYWDQTLLDDAIAAFEDAIRLDPNNAFAHVHLGSVYYSQEPSMVARVHEVLDEAIAINPTDTVIWQAVLEVWAFQEQEEEVAALCARADDTIRKNVGMLCWDGIGLPSSYHYALFVQTRVTDEAAAYYDLKSAITTDNGWLGIEERYDAWHTWALYQWQRGNAPLAAEALTIAVSIIPPTLAEPERAALHYFYASTLNATDQTDEALLQINEALALEPANAAFHIAYGEIRYKNESAPYIGANESFNNAVSLAPDAPDIWQNIVRFWLNERIAEQVLTWCSQTPAAILPIVQPSCWDGNGTPSLESMIAYNDATYSGDTDGATVALEAATTSDQGWYDGAQQYEAWRLWGVLLYQQNRWEESNAALERAVALATDATSDAQLLELRQLQVDALLNQGENDAAFALLDTLASENPNNFWLPVQYAKALYRTDSARRADAIAMLNEVLDAQQDDTALWSNIAYFWVEQDDAAASTELCARANSTIAPLIALHCWTSDTSSHTFYTNYVAAVVAGDPTTGLADLEAAIQQNGGWIHETERFEAWAVWGRERWSTGQYEDAILISQQAIDYAPTEVNAFTLAEAYNVLGLSLSATQQPAEALAALSNAITIYPDYAWAQLVYAVLLHDADPTGNYDLAKEHFAIALRLAPNDAALWEAAIMHWQRYESVEAEIICQDSLNFPIANDVSALCGFS